MTDRSGADRGATIAVEFTISGRGFDPDEATRTIGLYPTRIWRQRHEHLRDRTDLADTLWAVGVPEQPYDSIDEAFQAVLNIVWPVRGAIREFVDRRALKAGFEAVIKVFGSAPVYCLEAPVLSQVAWFNCGCCLAIYDYSDIDE